MDKMAGFLKEWNEVTPQHSRAACHENIGHESRYYLDLK
jgi:hypothetical protein